jgi:hypothetical protein
LVSDLKYNVERFYLFSASLIRDHPVKGFARVVVQAFGDGVEFVLRERGEIRAEVPIVIRRLLDFHWSRAARRCAGRRSRYAGRVFWANSSWGV